MLNKRTKIIRKCRHKNKYALASYNSMDWSSKCKMDVSWNFWNLWQSDLLLLWSRLTENSSISINFKSRCVLYNVYSLLGVTITHVHTFQGSKEDFRVCAVASFEKRNHEFIISCCKLHSELCPLKTATVETSWELLYHFY